MVRKFWSGARYLRFSRERPQPDHHHQLSRYGSRRSSYGSQAIGRSEDLFPYPAQPVASGSRSTWGSDHDQLNAKFAVRAAVRHFAAPLMLVGGLAGCGSFDIPDYNNQSLGTGE